MPFCTGFDGSDGTRTRDLRRDRTAVGRRDLPRHVRRWFGRQAPQGAPFVQVRSTPIGETMGVHPCGSIAVRAPKLSTFGSSGSRLPGLRSADLSIYRPGVSVEG